MTSKLWENVTLRLQMRMTGISSREITDAVTVYCMRTPAADFPVLHHHLCQLSLEAAGRMLENFVHA